LSGPGVLHTVPQERSPVHTASHTAAMARLAQLAVALGSPLWKAELGRLPGAVRAALQLRSQVVQALDRLQMGRVVHYVGGGLAYATVRAGPLKLGEAAYVSPEGPDVHGSLHVPLIRQN